MVQVRIYTLWGQLLEFNMDKHNLVQDLRQQVAQQVKKPPFFCLLIHKCKYMLDEHTLDFYFDTLDQAILYVHMKYDLGGPSTQRKI